MVDTIIHVTHTVTQDIITTVITMDTVTTTVVDTDITFTIVTTSTQTDTTDIIIDTTGKKH